MKAIIFAEIKAITENAKEEPTMLLQVSSSDHPDTALMTTPISASLACYLAERFQEGDFFEEAFKTAVSAFAYCEVTGKPLEGLIGKVYESN